MELVVEQLENGVTRVNLRGRLDVLGAQAIDMKFTVVTSVQSGLILVDLSDVSFLASLGIRTLISSARALSMRGGHMILSNPQPHVLEVLTTSGISELIPVHNNIEGAIQALLDYQPA